MGRPCGREYKISALGALHAESTTNFTSMDYYTFFTQGRSAPKTRVVGPHFLALAEAYLSSLIQEYCPDADSRRHMNPFVSTVGSKVCWTLKVVRAWLTYE